MRLAVALGILLAGAPAAARMPAACPDDVAVWTSFGAGMVRGDDDEPGGESLRLATPVASYRLDTQANRVEVFFPVDRASVCALYRRLRGLGIDRIRTRPTRELDAGSRSAGVDWADGGLSVAKSATSEIHPGSRRRWAQVERALDQTRRRLLARHLSATLRVEVFARTRDVQLQLVAADGAAVHLELRGRAVTARVPALRPPISVKARAGDLTFEGRLDAAPRSLQVAVEDGVLVVRPAPEK